MNVLVRRFWCWRLRTARRQLQELKTWWPQARAQAGFYSWYIDDQFWHNWELIRARIERISRHLRLSEQMVNRLTRVEKPLSV